MTGDQKSRTVHRDGRTGRFARRPVPGVDAESRFDPMGDSIEDVDNVSGAASPSTIDHARYAPEADDLAQGGSRSPLRARNAELVPQEQDEALTRYGNRQGAVSRAAARRSAARWDDPTPWLTGASHGTPGDGMRQASDE